MSNQQILETAIQKAIDGGWMPTDKRYLNWSTETIIFNHDFAKALWGEKMYEDAEGYETPAWQYELQQMVIADDPIKYLGENI